MRSKMYMGYEVFENGDVINRKGNKLKPDTSSEYYRVTLCNKGFQKRMLVHRLIALLFILNPENKPEVNHKDGKKLNNWWWNLEWCTKSENGLHAHRIGLVKNDIGSQDNQSIQVIQKDLNGHFIAEYGSIMEAERVTGISHGSIARCVKKIYKQSNGFTWSKKWIY